MEDLHANISLTKKIFFVFLTFVIGFLCLELLVRWLGYRPRPAERRTVTGYFLVADQVLGFRNRANGRYVNMRIQGSPVATTDQFGYRNSYSCPLASRPQTVVFVGDSATFCGEVNDDETGPSEVAKAHCFRGVSVHVINTAVRAYNTVQAKRMLIEALGRFPSVAVAVYVYSDNDFLENLNPTMYYPLRAPTAQLKDETGEIVEVDPQSEIVPWGHSFSEAKTTTVSIKQRVKNAIANGSSQSALLQFGAISLSIALATPGFTRYWADIKEREAWAKQHGGEKILEQLIREMKAACDRTGTQFIATRFTPGMTLERPSGEENINADKWLAEICSRANAKFVGISDHFQGDPKQYMVRFADSRYYDGHYGRVGARTFAEAIGPAIQTALSRGSK
jgi:hypothetical protein